MGRHSVGDVGPGVRAHYTYTDFSPGPVEFTDNPFDFAIQGEGFFAVETPEGTRYTRDGAFTTDVSGFLVDQSGNRVLDRNGEHIFADEPVDPQLLQVVNFETPQQLERRLQSVQCA